MNIIKKEWNPEHLRYVHIFDEYLKGGILPFSLEEPEVMPLLSNTVKKIIQRDIPYVSSLKTDELLKIEKTLEFIGKASVAGVNYSTLSRNIGITKYKAESYVRLLEQSFLLSKFQAVGLFCFIYLINVFFIYIVKKVLTFLFIELK